MKKATMTACLMLGLVQMQMAQHRLADNLPNTRPSDISLTVSHAPQEALVYVSWEMHQPGPAILSILDTEGHMAIHIPLKYVPQSFYSKAISVQAFSAGTYWTVISTNGKFFIQSFEVADQVSIH